MKTIIAASIIASALAAGAAIDYQTDLTATKLLIHTYCLDKRPWHVVQGSITESRFSDRAVLNAIYDCADKHRSK